MLPNLLWLHHTCTCVKMVSIFPSFWNSGMCIQHLNIFLSPNTLSWTILMSNPRLNCYRLSCPLTSPHFFCLWLTYVKIRVDKIFAPQTRALSYLIFILQSFLRKFIHSCKKYLNMCKFIFWFCYFISFYPCWTCTMQFG